MTPSKLRNSKRCHYLLNIYFISYVNFRSDVEKFGIFSKENENSKIQIKKFEMQKENLKFNSRMSQRCNDSIKQMTECNIRSSKFDIFIRK